MGEVVQGKLMLGAWPNYAATGKSSVVAEKDEKSLYLHEFF